MCKVTEFALRGSVYVSRHSRESGEPRSGAVGGNRFPLTETFAKLTGRGNTGNESDTVQVQWSPLWIPAFAGMTVIQRSPFEGMKNYLRKRIEFGECRPHISHINPAGLVVISNRTTRCSRIAERSAYHEC